MLTSNLSCKLKTVPKYLQEAIIWIFLPGNKICRRLHAILTEIIYNFFGFRHVWVQGIAVTRFWTLKEEKKLCHHLNGLKERDENVNTRLLSFFSIPDVTCSHTLGNIDTGILKNMTWALTSLIEWVSETFFSNLCAHKAQMQLPTVLPRLPRLWI